MLDKSNIQLSKRFERREEAKEEGEEAKETGTAEDMDRFSRRTVKVTREHNEECRRLLKLMGIPVVVVRPCYSFESRISNLVNRPHRKPKRNALNLREEERYEHIPTLIGISFIVTPRSTPLAQKIWIRSHSMHPYFFVI